MLQGRETFSDCFSREQRETTGSRAVCALAVVGGGKPVLAGITEHDGLSLGGPKWTPWLDRRHSAAFALAHAAKTYQLRKPFCLFRLRRIGPLPPVPGP